MKENLQRGFERATEKVEDGVRRGAAQTKDLASVLSSQFEVFVRDSPLLALGSAFAVGYLIARLARIRS